VLTKPEIMEAIADPEWQKFRVSLKGEDTVAKLGALCVWQAAHKYSRKSVVQVENYLNALKRGGQLNVDGTIKRER